VRKTAMVGVEASFDVVITSNSGDRLNLNLYQAVKGMSAAARVVREGGSIIIAAECWDGVPDHGEYKDTLHMAGSPQALLEVLRQPGFLVMDQWEAQLQAQTQCRADVYVKSRYLSDDETRSALLRSTAPPATRYDRPPVGTRGASHPARRPKPIALLHGYRHRPGRRACHPWWSDATATNCSSRSRCP